MLVWLDDQSVTTNIQAEQVLLQHTFEMPDDKHLGAGRLLCVSVQ